MSDGGREVDAVIGEGIPGNPVSQSAPAPAGGASLKGTGGRVINSSVPGDAARCNPLVAAANIINNTHQIEISLESARRWLIKI